MEITTEPPDWAQPMRHYLGAALLKNAQFEQAEAVYRKDLKWNQKNGWSHGLYQSLKSQGRIEESEEVYKMGYSMKKAANTEITTSHL